MYPTMTRRPADRPTDRLWLAWLALGVLLAGSWHLFKKTHHERRHARSAALPPSMQTWEGEGGRPDPDPGPDVASPP